MDEQQQQQQQQKHNTKFRQKYDVITTATQDQHSVLQTTTATAADTTTDTRYIHTHTALRKTHNNQPHTNKNRHDGITTNTRRPNRMQQIIHTTINHTAKEEGVYGGRDEGRDAVLLTNGTTEQQHKKNEKRDGINHYNSRNICCK